MLNVLLEVRSKCKEDVGRGVIYKKNTHLRENDLVRMIKVTIIIVIIY